MSISWFPKHGYVQRGLGAALAALLVMATLVFAPGVAPRADAQQAPDQGSCNADILFILDTSGSMVNAGLNAVENAFESFVTELGKPVASGGAPDSGIAALHFSNSAVVHFATYQNVVGQAAALNAYVSPGGAYRAYGHNWTNWEDAFVKANTLSTPDFVFFLTDGQPTIFNGDGNPANNAAKWEAATEKAVPYANTLRTAVPGTTTVKGIGVGDGFSSTAGALGRLQRVTDEAVAIPWSDLADELAADINEICKPSLTVTKTVSPTSLPEPGGTATFTARVENTSSTSQADIRLNTLTDDTHATFPSSASCRIDGSGPTVNAFDAWIPYGHSLVCSWQITFAGKAPGWSETDVVTARGADPLGRMTAIDDDSATVTITDVGSSILVAKTVQGTTSRPEPGGTFTFSVVITNTSPVDTVTITSISDSPYGTLTGTNPALTNSSCSVDQVLAPSGIYSCSFSVDVTGTPGPHSDTVTASGYDDDQKPVTGSGDATVTITDVAPTITVDKTANPTSVKEPGGNVDFTVTVTNDSNEGVTITKLVDSIYGTLAGDADCKVGTPLAAGASCSFTFTKAVTGNAGDIHRNTATATAVDNDGTEDSGSGDATVTITDVAPTITVDKTAVPGAVAEPGGTVAFRITVTNTGAAEDLELTTLVDDVFGNLDTVGDCAVPQVLAQDGTPYTCTFEGLVSGVGGDVHTNEATATAIDDDGNTVISSDTEDVEILSAMIDVAKTGTLGLGDDDIANPGDVITYVITVTNTGDATLYGVDVEDLLPGLSELSCKVIESQDDSSLLASFAKALLGILGPNDAVECTGNYVITQDDIDAGGVANCAVASGTTAQRIQDEATSTEDPDRVSEQDCIETTIPQSPSINVTKTVDQSTIAVAGTAVFTIIVTNTGNVTLTDVSVSDAMEYGTDEREQLTQCEDPELSTLAPGQDMMIECDVALDIMDHGTSILNTVTATGTPPSGPDVSDDAEVPVALTPPSTEGALAIDKKVGPLGTPAGSAAFVDPYVREANETWVTWQITVTNTRTYPLFQVDLTDAASPGCVTAFEEAVSSADDGNTLAPLETLVFTCDLDVGEGPFINTVSVEGVDPWGQEIDPANDTATTLLVLASGTIGDLVWSDDNGNGVRDNDEKGIAGATVTLTLPDGSTLSTTTNTNGLYLFSALPAGTFTAQLVMSSIPAPSDGSNKLTTPGAFTVSLAEGQSVLTADFGVTAALPTTGIESDLMAAIGFALALMGGAALIATRRRREGDSGRLAA